VLDAAHNVASIEAFLQTLQESFYATSRVLVFATTRDKDVRGMLDRLLPKFDYVVFTRYIHNPRSVPPEELAATAAELAANLKTTPNVSIAPNPEAAWHMVAALADRDDLVGITGSFFLAAEIRPVIQAQPLCTSPASAAKR
jgi:dihydrofolate synthase/folylpolyglutamate synthase